MVHDICTTAEAYSSQITRNAVMLMPSKIRNARIWWISMVYSYCNVLGISQANNGRILIWLRLKWILVFLSLGIDEAEGEIGVLAMSMGGDEEEVFFIVDWILLWLRDISKMSLNMLGLNWRRAIFNLGIIWSNRKVRGHKHPALQLIKHEISNQNHWTYT